MTSWSSWCKWGKYDPTAQLSHHACSKLHHERESLSNTTYIRHSCPVTLYKPTRFEWPPLNGNSPLKPHIPTRSPNHNPKLALGNDPLPIPVTQVPPPHIERRRPTLPRLERHLVEAPKLPRGRLGRRVREGDVKLGDLGASDVARVGDGGGDGRYGLEKVGGATGGDGAGCGAAGGGGVDCDVGVLERRVRYSC